jgi:hypothetical protein
MDNLGKWEGLQNQHVSSFKDLLANRKADLLTTSQKMGPLSPELNAIQRQFERADFLHQAISKVLLRPLNRYSIAWPHRRNIRHRPGPFGDSGQ